MIENSNTNNTENDVHQSSKEIDYKNLHTKLKNIKTNISLLEKIFLS